MEREARCLARAPREPQCIRAPERPDPAQAPAREFHETRRAAGYVDRAVRGSDPRLATTAREIQDRVDPGPVTFVQAVVEFVE